MSKTKRDVDWGSIAVCVAGLVWASWYVWSARSNPFDEPQAFWLITPLLIGLWIIAPLVLWSAIGPLPERLIVDPDEGLGVPARWRFVISLPILAGIIWALGFVVTILIYMPCMTLALGERRSMVIGGLTGALIALILGGFVWGLGVSLPLWPRIL